MRRLAQACAAAVLCATAAPVLAGTTLLVVSEPTSVLEGPRRGAEVITIAARASVVELIGREDGWCWIVLARDEYGTRRAGWVPCKVIDAARPQPPSEPAAQPPVGPTPAVTEAPANPEEGEGRTVARGGPSEAVGARRDDLAAAAARSAASKAAKPIDYGPPPVPVGMEDTAHRSTLAAWIQPRMLRAAFTGGYEAAQNGSAGAVSDDRILQGGLTLSTSFAILDPRVATFDFTGDFQTGRNNRATPASAYHNGNTLQSYRFDAAFLSGRSAPLRVFSDRVSTDTSVLPLGASLDPSQFTHGVRNSTGFTWDVNVPRRPRLQVSASTGGQSDYRNYLFGFNSFNTERRAEARLSQDLRLGRYDVDFTYGQFVYDVPDANARSDTGNELLHGTAHLQPSSALSLDVTGRFSRYRFGLANQQSRVTGVGADLAGRYRFSSKLNASGRYSFSSNAFEALLSGAIAGQDVRAAEIASPAPLATNTLFHDAEGRVEYGGTRASVAAISRFTSYGVPAFQPVTLGGLQTVGGLARAERRTLGMSLTGSVDFSVGTASSNRSQKEPYREAGIQAGVSREWAQRIRFSADGAVRGVGRLSFYPVSLDSRALTAALETMVPASARLRLAVTWSNNLRDILYNDNRDQHTGYTVGLTGRWYDVAIDFNQLSTRSILLGADVLGTRPDVALLVTSRPEISRSFLGSSDRSRALSVHLRPWAGFDVNGRVVRQTQQYPSLFDLFQSGEQVWAVWQLRQLQFEFGWERLASTSSFSVVDGRRVYFRVRRDLTFF